MSTRNSPLVARRARSGAAAILASLALIASLFVASPAVAAEPVAATAPVSAASAPGVSTGIVKAAPVVGFDPENIISDALFYDGGAMTAAEIQSFLDSKIGRCENGKCLNVINASISDKAEWVSQTTGQLVCSAIKGGTMKASELIYRMQTACGISAKVILVTLQKEQGLVTSTAPSDWNLQAAMGASCPDTAPCDPSFKGVGPQIFKGTQQLKTYKATRFARQPGVHFIGWSPNSACGGTNLNIRNYATAALYNYTPYQPNSAALNAGYGIGDGCSSYGNRNFYNYYKQWFGSTVGSGDPVGEISSWELVEQGIRIRGWAVDPDSMDSVSVRVKSGDTMLARATASAPGVSAAGFEGYGRNRGIDTVVPLAPGKQTVCVVANNIGAGSNRTIGCVETTPVGGSPYGAVTSWQPTPTGVRISGWVIDPDTTGPTSVRIKDGETMLARQTADSPVVALSSSHAAFGSAHGFSVEVSTGPVPREICVAANNVGVGSNRTLGCREVTAAGGDPIGAIDLWEPRVGGVRIVGWVVDPDTAAPISVRVKAGTSTTRVTADVVRDDIQQTVPGYGSSHGFDVRITLPPGKSEVCVAMNNVGAGANRTLGCSTINILSGDAFGAAAFTPTAKGFRVSGWVIDPDTRDPISVRVKAGPAQLDRLTAALDRPDVARLYPAYGPAHGYEGEYSLAPGTHVVCVVANNVGGGKNRTLGCSNTTVRAGDPFGAVDSWEQTGPLVRIRGWVIDPDVSGAISVRVKIGDTQAARVTADLARPGLAGMYPAYGESHGFDTQVRLPLGDHTVCVAANNVGEGVNRTLACRPVVVRGGDPVGAVTSWTVRNDGIEVAGWAVDPDTDAATSVRVKVGELSVARLTANLVGAPASSHGFSGFVPLGAGQHVICVAANNVGVGQNRTLGCKTVSIAL